jgi:hypothetical protein
MTHAGPARKIILLAALAVFATAATGPSWAHGGGATGGASTLHSPAARSRPGHPHAVHALSSLAPAVSARMPPSPKHAPQAATLASTPFAKTQAHAALAPASKPRARKGTPTAATADPTLSPQGAIAGGARTPSASACEGEAQVNCEARAQATRSAAGGDPDPVWAAPAPTAVPPAPAEPPVPEPPAPNTQNFEESGGVRAITPEGGAPTLADCMSLWSPDVHMTKVLWKDVCVRTMNGIDEPSLALGR